MKKGESLKLLQELRQKRRKIDVIDRRLLGLLNQRLRIALGIGKTKRAMGEKIHNPQREKVILERLTGNNKGPLKEEDLKKIFTTIMKVCRKSQTT